MDLVITLTGEGEESVKAPVGKCGDRVAAYCPLTMHQAASLITMFRHRIRKKRSTLRDGKRLREVNAGGR